MRNLFLTLILLTAVTCNCFAGQGMQSQVDSIVDGMSTYTAPGKYETAESTGFQGGRYTEKYPVANFNLFHMDLPSYRGGCNGIDIFGGSYSFIDADQLIESLKKVAANAKGYAFQLAMDQMCPSCVKWMNELRDSMQKLNSDLGNSCQLAQGLVTGGANALIGKEVYDSNLKNVASGLGTDLTAVKNAITNVNPAEWEWFGSLDPASKKKALETTKGSVAYRALNNNGAHTWYSTGADKQFIEEIISMTGHVVVHSGVDDAGNPDPTSPAHSTQKPSFDLLPPLNNSITLRVLMKGDNVQEYEIYNCGASVDLPQADNCNITKDNVHTIKIRGISKRLEEVLLGDASYWKLNKLRTISSDISTADKNIISALPGNFGPMYLKLSALHSDSAELFTTQTIDAISLEFTYQMVRRNLDNFEASVLNSNDTHKDDQLKQISSTRDRIQSEYELLKEKTGSLKDVQSYFANLLMITPKSNYLVHSNKTTGGQ